MKKRERPERPERPVRGATDENLTLVAPTSVADGGGLGVYALQNISRGTYLPFPYPGNHISKDEFSALNDYLFALNLVKPEQWDSNSTDEILKYLQNRFGISILKKRPADSGQKAIRIWSPPNWSAIYDTMVSYLYETADGGRIVWPTYNWDTGAIVADSEKPELAALFINEPPPYRTFRNRWTKKSQPSTPNVKVIDGPQGQKLFEATRDIRKGDEILLCYGPLYNRTFGDDGQKYDINLDMKSGCGNRDELLTYYTYNKITKQWQLNEPLPEESDVEKLVDYLDDIRTFQFKGDEFVAADLQHLVREEEGEEEVEEEVEEESAKETSEEAPLPSRKRRDILPIKKQPLGPLGLAWPGGPAENVEYFDIEIPIPMEISDEEVEIEELHLDEDEEEEYPGKSPMFGEYAQMAPYSPGFEWFIEDLGEVEIEPFSPFWFPNIHQIEEIINLEGYQNVALVDPSALTERSVEALKNRPDGWKIAYPDMLYAIRLIVEEARKKQDLKTLKTFYTPEMFDKYTQLSSELEAMELVDWYELKQKYVEPLEQAIEKLDEINPKVDPKVSPKVGSMIRKLRFLLDVFVDEDIGDPADIPKLEKMTMDSLSYATNLYLNHLASLKPKFESPESSSESTSASAASDRPVNLSELKNKFVEPLRNARKQFNQIQSVIGQKDEITAFIKNLENLLDIYVNERKEAAAQIPNMEQTTETLLSYANMYLNQDEARDALKQAQAAAPRLDSPLFTPEQSKLVWKLGQDAPKLRKWASKYWERVLSKNRDSIISKKTADQLEFHYRALLKKKQKEDK